MSVMTPENQGRFEKCIELVELGALPPECLATVAEGIARKQRGNINKAPQTLQPDVTLRSGGGGSTFLGRSACPSTSFVSLCGLQQFVQSVVFLCMSLRTAR